MYPRKTFERLRASAGWLIAPLATGLLVVALTGTDKIGITSKWNPLIAATTTTTSSPLLLVASIVALVGAGLMSSKLWNFIHQRRRLFKLFDQLGIPSLGKPSLLSGNLYETFFNRDSGQRLDEYHKRLGKTFGLFYGPDPWVMTTDLELLRRVFVAEGGAHVNRNNFRLPMFAEFDLAVVQLKGDEWRQVRKLMGTSFTAHQMRTDNVYRDIQQVCNLICEGMDAKLASTRASGGPSGDGGQLVMNLASESKRFTSETTTRLLYGCQRMTEFVPNEKDHLVELMEAGMQLLNGTWTRLCIQFNLAQWLCGAMLTWTPIGHLLRYIHSNLDSYLSLRTKRAEPQTQQQQQVVDKTQRKMIDSLIAGFREGKLGFEMLKSSLFFSLIAGIETSSVAIAILCWHLAMDQAKQDKLRRSILEQGGEQSEYLTWCIKETIRLYPPVPTAVGRVLEHDLEHEGMQLKKGMSVVTNIWSIHRSREYWGADFAEFKPERFDESSGPKDHGSTSSSSWPLRFFGFGVGPRYCIGQHLAMAQIRALITKLVVKYQLKPCPTTPSEIKCLTPNMIQLLIDHPIDVAFVPRNH